MRSMTVVLASASLLALALPAEAEHCGAPAQNPHTYGIPGSAGATAAQVGMAGGGAVLLYDNNTSCDADGDGTFLGDFDGDFEFGIGGAYFGIAGNEQVARDCGLGLHLHAGTEVVVEDAVHPAVPFLAGYEGRDDSEGPCVNEDPNADHVVGDDPQDCLVHYPFGGPAPVDPCAGEAGLNLDAGIFLFLQCHASDAPAVVCATTGTVTVR